jgi:hypothetical protein
VADGGRVELHERGAASRHFFSFFLKIFLETFSGFPLKFSSNNLLDKFSHNFFLDFFSFFSNVFSITVLHLIFFLKLCLQLFPNFFCLNLLFQNFIIFLILFLKKFHKRFTKLFTKVLRNFSQLFYETFHKCLFTKFCFHFYHIFLLCFCRRVNPHHTARHLQHRWAVSTWVGVCDQTNSEKGKDYGRRSTVQTRTGGRP